MEKTELEHIEDLSPATSIEQKTISARMPSALADKNEATAA